MNAKEIRQIAYEIQKAYDETATQGAAIEKIKEKFPDADLEILWAMWAAIDAYKDMHNNV